MIDDQDNDFLYEEPNRILRNKEISLAHGTVLGTPIGSHFAAWCRDNGVDLEDDDANWALWWNCFLAGCKSAAKITVAELREMQNCAPIYIEEAM